MIANSKIPLCKNAPIWLVREKIWALHELEMLKLSEKKNLPKTTIELLLRDERCNKYILNGLAKQKDLP